MPTNRLLLAGALLLASALHLPADLPPLPQPATSFGAAIVDGWIYLYGGNTGKAHEFHRECIKGDLFRAQLSAGTAWERLSMDAPLLGAAMAAYGGWIYRVGGMEARNEKGAPNDLHSTAQAARFQPATQRWEPLPPMPEPRSSHDVAVLGDVLYAGGGWKLEGGRAGKWHQTALTLDLRTPEQGWQSQSQPFQRRALAVVSHTGRLWFLGGMNEHDEPSREVDWFDPRTKEWGHGPELPEGPMQGFGVAACSAGGRLLANPLSGIVYALSEDGQRWEEAATLTRPRFFHRLLPTPDGRLVAVGGSSRQEQILEPEFVSITTPRQRAAIAPLPVQPEPPNQPAALAPWPQWRGPQRDGISPERSWQKDWTAKVPPLLWRAQVGAGMSSCVIAGGLLFTQGNDGHGTDCIVALDSATGIERWRYSFSCASSPHEMPIVPPGPCATPTIYEGNLFALSREGDFFCLNARTGRVVYRKHLVTDLGGKRPVYGNAQSPLVENGRVFLDVGCGADREGSTVALDSRTGELLWRAGHGEAGYSSARSFERDGRRLVAMFKGEALDVFQAENGHVLWSYRTTARDFANATTPTFVGHRLLVSNTGTDLAALLDWDLGADANVRTAWTHKQFALLFNSPIALDGCLFAFNEKRRGHDEFTCVDAQTGETRWVSGAVPTSTFILADGHWIFFTRDGEVILAPAGSGELKPTHRFKAVEGKCYATPALAAARLYLRSNSGEVAAYDLQAATVAITATVPR